VSKEFNPYDEPASLLLKGKESGPCSNYAEDPAITDAGGDPKGQCECGYGKDDHIVQTDAELDREKRIRDLAFDHYDSDDIDIDLDAIVSEGDDNGAYVAAWVWVRFRGEPGLDKEPMEDEP